MVTLSAYLDITKLKCDYDGDGNSVLASLTDQLSAYLNVKGIAMQWLDRSDGAKVILEIDRLSEGNRVIRYVVGFGAGAVSLSGKVSIHDGTAWHSMPIMERKSFGMFGGDENVLLQKVAQKAAQKIGAFMINYGGFRVSAE